MLLVVNKAIFICFTIYMIIALLGLFYFQNDITINIIDNIGTIGIEKWESVTLRIIFLVVITCHIPFIFYIGK